MSSPQPLQRTGLSPMRRDLSPSPASAHLPFRDGASRGPQHHDSTAHSPSPTLFSRWVSPTDPAPTDAAPSAFWSAERKREQISPPDPRPLAPRVVAGMLSPHPPEPSAPSDAPAPPPAAPHREAPLDIASAVSRQRSLSPWPSAPPPTRSPIPEVLGEGSADGAGAAGSAGPLAMPVVEGRDQGSVSDLVSSLDELLRALTARVESSSRGDNAVQLKREISRARSELASVGSGSQNVTRRRSVPRSVNSCSTVDSRRNSLVPSPAQPAKSKTTEKKGSVLRKERLLAEFRSILLQSHGVERGYLSTTEVRALLRGSALEGRHESVVAAGGQGGAVDLHALFAVERPTKKRGSRTGSAAGADSTTTPRSGRKKSHSLSASARAPSGRLT